MAMASMTETVPFVDASPLLNQPAALRARAGEDGYLFFRGLLPPELLRSLRKEVLELCAGHGWLDESAPHMNGIVANGKCVIEGSTPEWKVFYRDVLRLRSFHSLAAEPALLNMYSKVFDEEAILHSRNICRVLFPSTSEFTTPPHQDHLYIGGTTNTWTCWMPLGDCPEELGGLAVIPGSQRWGFVKSQPGKGAGGRQVAVPEDAVWHSSPFQCGDVLTFHSLTVHQGKDNQTTDRLRLSVDYRYQPVSEAIRRDSMEPHMGGFGLTWDDIYKGWPAEDPLKFYWQARSLNYVE